MTIRHDCAALTGAKEAGRGGPVRKVEGAMKLRNVDMSDPSNSEQLPLRMGNCEPARHRVICRTAGASSRIFCGRRRMPSVSIFGINPFLGAVMYGTMRRSGLGRAVARLVGLPYA